MAVVRKKQDDKHLKTLREIVSLGGNKQCFDCGQRGPTYVNMTIGAFVCTRCSGLLRGITPPHRVKSISMATFSSDEIEFIRSHGNDTCAKTWLGLWDPKRVLTQDQRDLMVDKYERKRYYLEPASPLKSLPQHTQNNANNGTLINGLLHSGNSSNNCTPIALTPPASLRLGASTRNATTTAPSIKTNGSTTTHQFQTKFTPDDQPAGMFGLKPSTTNNNIINNSPSFNGKSKQQPHASPANGTVVARHGMSGLSGSQAPNGDRTTARLSGPPNANNNNSNNINNNGRALDNKFTPDGDFGTDFGASSALFGDKANGQQRNGADNANADFADFEHNAIFNAAGLPMSLSSTSAGSLNSSGSTPFNSSNSSINSTPPVDRYAALKDLDMQLREVVKDTGLFSSGSSNSSNSTGNSSSVAGNNTTAAAAAAAASNGIATANGTPTHLQHGDANPFKAQHHQFGHVSGATGSTVVNPFQPVQPVQPNANCNGWATDFGNAAFANTAATMSHMQQQHHQQQHMLHASMFGNGNVNGNGGFGGHHNSNGYHHAPAMQANGFGMMQRNPFAATTTGGGGGAVARSNNPFL